MMNKIILAGGLLLVLLLTTILLRETDRGKPQVVRAGVENLGRAGSEPGGAEVGHARSAPESNPVLAAIFSTPIQFYGKVQTREAEPVADAKIVANVATRFGGESAEIITKSDSQGRFQISTSGMNLAIRVSKQGYYEIIDEAGSAHRSMGGFDYGADLGSGIHQPNPAEPVVFTLVKPPPSEKIIRLRQQQVVVPRTGIPVRILLDEPTRVLELKCWTDDSNPERDGRHHWRLEIAVVGGGIQARDQQFDFLAPANGFESRYVIDMPKTLDRRDWKDDVKVWLWVRFEDGRFGLVWVRMIAGGAHFALVGGHLNPKTGSRNLSVAPE